MANKYRFFKFIVVIMIVLCLLVLVAFIFKWAQPDLVKEIEEGNATINITEITEVKEGGKFWMATTMLLLVVLGVWIGFVLVSRKFGSEKTYTMEECEKIARDLAKKSHYTAYQKTWEHAYHVKGKHKRCSFGFALRKLWQNEVVEHLPYWTVACIDMSMVDPKNLHSAFHHMTFKTWHKWVNDIKFGRVGDNMSPEQTDQPLDPFLGEGPAGDSFQKAVGEAAARRVTQ